MKKLRIYVNGKWHEIESSYELETDEDVECLSDEIEEEVIHYILYNLIDWDYEVVD